MNRSYSDHLPYLVIIMSSVHHHSWTAAFPVRGERPRRGTPSGTRAVSIFESEHVPFAATRVSAHALPKGQSGGAPGGMLDPFCDALSVCLCCLKNEKPG